MPIVSRLDHLRRVLIGTPLPTSAHHEERFSNLEALAILSLPSIGLMLIVATSYRQTIKAYPLGGGSYRVSQDNLGKIPGLVAGASLSIDDVLTVAVSVAAGIAALTSYLPALDAQRIPLCV
jgi:amino acid transporter